MLKPPTPLSTLSIAWVCLLILTVATYLTWKGSFGMWGEVANFAIAVAKASLVTIVFMEIRGSNYRARFAALAGLVWLAILAGLIASDYATRDWHSTPPFWTAGRAIDAKPPAASPDAFAKENSRAAGANSPRVPSR
jgi:cytochrome c oxidase subunit 4